MSRKAFHHLITRYLEGKCTEEEKKLVEQWYGMMDDEHLPEISRGELATIEQQLWEKVHEDMAEPRTPLLRRMWVRLSAAAVLAGLIALGAYLFLRSPDPVTMYTAAHQHARDTVNNTAGPLHLFLDDGSCVVLQPGAGLRYPASLTAGPREVFLEGDAYFDVNRLPAKPFIVYSNNVVVHVLGTSFTVKGRDGHAEVAVQTGKVAVAENRRGKAGRELVVTPNQKVVFDEEKDLLESTLVEAPQPILTGAPQYSGSFVFRDAAIPAVLQELEKTYGIEIIADAPTLAACTFTGDIRKEGLYDKLLMICQSINATYAIKGTKIYIDGKGCAAP